MKKRLSPVFWITTGLLIGLLFGTLITAAFSYRPQYDYDQMVATAGDTPITRGELAERLLFKYGTKVLDSDLKPDAIIREAARRAGITVSDAELDKRIADYKQLLEQYADLAELVGSKMQVDAIPDWLLHDQFRTELYAERLMRIDFPPDVMANKMDDMYKINMQKFMKPAMANLTLIVCKDNNQAWKLFNRLRSGEDPAVLSERFSAYDAIKNIKGQLGWVPKSEMNPDLASAVFDARKGQGLRPKEYTDVIDYKWLVRYDTDPKKCLYETNYIILYVNRIVPPKTTPKNEVLPVLDMLVRTTETANALTQKDKDGKDWFARAAETIPWKRVPLIADPLGKPTLIKEPERQPPGFLKPEGND